MGTARQTQAACPAELEAAIESEIGKPPDLPPDLEERSVDPGPVEGRGPAVRGAAAAGEDDAERR